MLTTLAYYVVYPIVPIGILNFFIWAVCVAIVAWGVILLLRWAGMSDPTMEKLIKALAVLFVILVLVDWLAWSDVGPHRYYREDVRIVR